MRNDLKHVAAIFWGVCLALAFSANVRAQITTQPQSLTINNNSTAAFTVGATNATNYQWQFDGANISGATNSSLTLEDVATNQAGTYTVLVNNELSSNAVLTLIPGTIVTFTFTGLLGAPGSNIQVQLFNHDKPITVQNFLHYITSGAYTNMFMDRCNPGFVLQGGDYGASNQTATSPPITGWSIPGQFINDDSIEPPLPSGINNEYGVGPLIHNRTGTIAMALNSQTTNSGSSAFFFNLEDNTSSLDDQDFTVFGQIISGTNLLGYFNSLTYGEGAVTNAEFVIDGDSTNQLPNPLLDALLPVDYPGTNAPANSNLVFCSFNLAQPPGATNTPEIFITSPVSNSIFDNGSTVTIQGLATDPNTIGLAWVRCDLIPLPAADGTYPNGGVGITNYILGATNWSVDCGDSIPPGTYSLGAQVQDEAGNLSSEVFQPLIVTAIATNGNGTVTLTQGSFSNLNAIGYPFQIGTSYSVLATAGTNALFANWTATDYNSIGAAVPFTMFDGLFATANFVSNSLPNGIAITYPGPNATIDTTAFNFAGTIANDPSPPVTVTCQVYSAANDAAVGGLLTAHGTNEWAETATNLAAGSYIVEAIAVDQAGNSTLVTNNFTVAPFANLQLTNRGPGSVIGATNGQSLAIGSTFQLTPVTNAGAAFYAWNDDNTFLLNPTQTFTMASGLDLTAIFVTNNTAGMIAFSYPPSNGIVGTNTLEITGTISNVSSAAISCQVFSATTMLAATQVYEGTGASSWQINVPGLAPGPYILVATANGPDGAGALISENFSVAYAANLQLTIIGHGFVSPVTNGEVLPIGTNFAVTATPGPGQVFYTWNNGSQITTNATLTNTMASGLALTATFIQTNTENGISITYPASHAILTTNNFPLKGKISPGMKSALVTCQFFQTNGVAVGGPMTTSGTNLWALDVTNLTGGNYIVEVIATNNAGNSTIVSQEFSILAFSAVQGTYNGLFICTNSTVSPTNSGYLTFTLTPTGAMTGKLYFPAYTPVPIYSLPFENIEFQNGFTEFSSANFHGHSLLGTLYIDLNDGTDLAFGTVSSSNWSSQLICYRAVEPLSESTTPATGKYTLSLQPVAQTNGPNTNGFAAVTVSKNGSLTVSGALPDNTTFSQSTTVSKNGIWPLYAVPSGVKTNGMLLGWAMFSNSASSGQLYWYKGSNIGSYYTNGIGVVSNMLLNSTGTNFSPPTAGSQYSIVFSGGSITAPLTNSLTVNNAGQFEVSGGLPDKLKMSLSNAGIITGTILDPVNNRTLHFSGAFLSSSQGGSGFIPEPDGQTGFFQLTPTP